MERVEGVVSRVVERGSEVQLMAKISTNTIAAIIDKYLKPNGCANWWCYWHGVEHVGECYNNKMEAVGKWTGKDVKGVGRCANTRKEIGEEIG